ncbi:MAG: hypothetical protein WAK29_00690 [Terriglobales bacterium]
MPYPKHILKAAVLTAASILAFVIPGPQESFGGDRPDPSPEAYFPRVSASNLEKRDFNLPADFAGDRNLLLVAFERGQQSEVDTWLREMKRFGEMDPGFRFYELPTIQRPSALMRWFIDNGMRHGIADREARERTITLYLDKTPFCEALRITDQKKIYAFLVDRQGKVLWRSEGPFDETKGASLQSALVVHRRD